MGYGGKGDVITAIPDRIQTRDQSLIDALSAPVCVDQLMSMMSAKVSAHDSLTQLTPSALLRTRYPRSEVCVCVCAPQKWRDFSNMCVCVYLCVHYLLNVNMFEIYV